VTLTGTNSNQREIWKEDAWNKLVTQKELAIRALQQDIEGLTCCDLQPSLLQKVRVRESIIQSLIFEIGVNRTSNLEVLLTPTITLFNHIFQDPLRLNIRKAANH
jgi:hypothetical protein